MHEAAIKLSSAINNFLALDLYTVNWEHKDTPERWSKKEILGHLVDSAQINLQRFIRCTYEENFKLVYEQVEWVKANNYQKTDLNELFTFWHLLNKRIMTVLNNYPEDRLLAQCDNGKDQISMHTIEFLAHDYVEHLNHHLRQIIN